MALTQKQIQDQVLAAGYNGPLTDAAIQAAFARTATPADFAASGLPQSLLGAQPVPLPSRSSSGSSGFNADALTSNITQALAPFAAQTSGVTQAELAEKKREFDATLAQQQRMWEQQGVPQLEIQRRSQALAEQEHADQMALAQQNIELQRANLGLSYLTQASQMSGPADYFQLSDFLRGAQQRGDVPLFLKALANNTQLNYQGGGGIPTPLTAGLLAGELTGAGGVGSAGPAAQPAVATTPGGTSSQSVFQQAMAAMNGTGPTVTVNGVPVSGAAVTTAYGGPPSAPRYNAPGPNSPNDTAQGSLIPGTTGMFQGATQNFGFGPGQGSNSISGTRGSNVVGYDPNTGDLAVDMRFLQPKDRVVAGLYDVTTGRYVVDPTVGFKESTGTYNPHGPGGWSNDPYISPGTGGRFTFGGVKGIDPTHMYTIQMALPNEGGVGSDINDPNSHPQFSGAQILGLPNHNAPQGATGAAAAGPAIDPNFMAPTTPEQQAMVQQNPAMGLAGYRQMLKQTRGYVWSPDEMAPTAAAAAPPPVPVVTPTGAPPIPIAPAPTSTSGGFSDAALGAIAGILRTGGQGLGPQALEQLNPDELALIQSGAKKLGYSYPAFLSSYQQSRIGQGAAQAA